MTRTEANAVARDMERCGYTVMSLYRNGGEEWAIDAHASTNMRTVTIHDSAQWIALEPDVTPTPTAGRPPVYGERMTARTIRCTDDTWAWILAQGIDYSDGVRKMAAEHKQAKEDA